MVNTDLLYVEKMSSTSVVSSFHNSSKLKIYIIAAVTPKMGIGHKNGLPWPHIKKDSQIFLKLTTGFKHRCSQSLSSGDIHESKQINAIIMGRNTWESIPVKFRPLPNRLNVIISTKLSEGDIEEEKRRVDDDTTDIRICRSFSESLNLLTSEYSDRICDVFIGGGSKIYDIALQSGLVDTIYLTRVGKDFPSESFFPSIPSAHSPCTYKNLDDVEKDIFESSTADSTPEKYPKKVCTEGAKNEKSFFYETVFISKSQVSNNIPLDFVVMKKREQQSTSLPTHDDNEEDTDVLCIKYLIEEQEKKKEQNESTLIRPTPSVKFRFHEEYQYLDLIADVINRGSIQEDRTGVGILSLFGNQMRFSLDQTFPLLTTKRVFFRGVVEELLWFIKGDTNANHLSEKGIKIWDQNVTREFLDSRGLFHREAGDIGPGYGFQWRHFGAKYKDMNTDYTGQGVDQLKKCIDSIKNNPTDRRILMTAWNPEALDEMALPPCHLLCQFYVSENSELSCTMYQRSCDMGLGVPFNIASYSLLTVMIAKICNLKPKEFIHVLGNTHVYKNHVNALKEQLQREPKPFPILKINGSPKDITDFKYEDFELIGYSPHQKIFMEMAV